MSTLTHGESRRGRFTPEYRAWAGAKDRCYNPNYKYFHRYGGRGIAICGRWIASFENFLKDMGRRPHGTSLDRKDNDGNYDPDNCKWSTVAQQQRNKKITVPRKLTDQQVEEIRIRIDAGETLRSIAKLFNVTDMAIHYHKKKSSGEVM